MRQLKGYANAQVIQSAERLPAGNYICKVLGVEYQNATGRATNDTLVISFDIEEGDYKGYYTSLYKSSSDENKKWKGNYRLKVPNDDGTEEDNRVQNRFKTVMAAIEESNSGYHWNWDENTLKGKLFGGLFRDKQWELDGRQGFWTECFGIASVADVRSGKLKVAEPKYLNNTAPAPATTQTPDGFMSIPSGIEDELPFA